MPITDYVQRCEQVDIGNQTYLFYFSCVPLSLICHSTTIVRNKELIHIQANKKSEKRYVFITLKNYMMNFVLHRKVRQKVSYT